MNEPFYALYTIDVGPNSTQIYERFHEKIDIAIRYALR